MKKRYAIAGTGVRSLCFANALLNEHHGTCELVALLDTNPLRMAGFCELLARDIPRFADFAEMARSARPDCLIIGTPDATHDAMIAQAFAHDMNVICEKPLTTTPEKLARILELEQTTGRSVRVAFNYRYVPYVRRIKEILAEASLGKALSVSLSWYLDKVHGAEYFRRWHASMEQSGGLLVHKATHHFDLVNWLLNDEPVEVSAMADLLVFGRKGPFRAERCSTCPYAQGQCEYVMRVHEVEQDRPIFEKLYWQAEAADDYLRDRCVFRNEIDIYDTMNVLVKYRSGTQMSYALSAYNPSAGYELSITFEQGRIEAAEWHTGINMYSENKERAIRIYRGHDRSQQTCEVVKVSVDPSAHGGGDARLYRSLFSQEDPDTFGQSADSRAGALSCLIGMAANRSIQERRRIPLPSLLPAAAGLFRD